MDNCYLVSFLLVNAIFWSFFPHSAHCKVVFDINKFLRTNIKCPAHTIHLIMGITFYFLTLYFAQQKYIHKQLL